MKECEYFGYLIRKKVIEDDDIISYYKPEITQIFVDYDEETCLTNMAMEVVHICTCQHLPPD
jgi:hypothetical protein